jgi:hypothetical protein
VAEKLEKNIKRLFCMVRGWKYRNAYKIMVGESKGKRSIKFCTNLTAMICLDNLRRADIVLLTTKFLDVAKFTTLTPLSLLISCKL